MGISDGIHPVWTIVGTAVVAFVSGMFMLFSGKTKARSEVQIALNDGFNRLVADLQEERAHLRSIVREQGHRIVALEGSLRNRQQEIDSLRRFIGRNGLTPPPSVRKRGD